MTSPYSQTRLSSVKSLLDPNQLDAILLTGLENIRYLSGFTGSDGVLLVTRDRSYFMTDSRYWTQADEEVKEVQIIHYKKKIEGICTLASDLGLRSLGFESANLPYAGFQALSGRLGENVRLSPLESALKNLRSRKDREELQLIRKAVEIASGAFLHATERIRNGVTEGTIAFEMECFMKQHGAEGLSFDIIVASGKRAALPHGRAGDKRIEQGDFILMDYGTCYQGYHSDETCTVVLGKPSPEQEKTYQIVKEAHDLAIEKIRPGIPIEEVDRTARNHIREAGYGDYFGHSTGHGVGLAVHEDPAVNSENKDLLQEGMVFTVEPGIYLPDWGGVRIEDMVLVTAHGPEILTPLSKELRSI